MKQLYQELILDHNKKPRNFHVMEDFDHESLGHNPLCGDKLVVYIKIGEGDTIEDVSFVGEGCAISKASASMMTTALKGKTIQEAKVIYTQFHEMSTGKLDIAEHPHQLGKLAIFAGVRDLPARVKCATLAWHTLDAALEGRKSITTE
ncbi:MAG: SUF system NifU family Fe-S cluster assembly protein [Balneolales bacterium]|nr:SUF system NifU family Fe-S cluster assembly protein [Balneolales bacterium]